MDDALRVRLRNLQFDINYILKSDYRFNVEWYKKKFHKMPDFQNPTTFAEKLLFLKMHYNNMLQNVCADKYTVMEYVRQCGYPEIIKECYQVCMYPDEIDLSLMPDRFFIQCSHTQGHNYVIDKKDKDKLEKVKKIYRQLLKRKHYKVLRENCYKYIQPRIICSEYLEEKGKASLTDYKFYCFSGEPKYFMVSYGEFEHDVKNHKFDMEWNSIDHYFKRQPAIPATDIVRPANFEKMVEIAKKLSAPFPHVRVDLYNLEGRIVFGEMTFYSAGGFVKIDAEDMNRTVGGWIDLSKYKCDLIRGVHLDEKYR